MADERFNESIMTHGWPECGAGRIDVEELYQMFKERLLKEVYAGRPRADLGRNVLETMKLYGDGANG